MRKLVLAFVVMAVMGCATSTVNQVELYGIVEDVVYCNDHVHVKAWCQKHQKYYYVVTDRRYQIGDVIRIK
jgi:predicted porin